MARTLSRTSRRWRFTLFPITGVLACLIGLIMVRSGLTQPAPSNPGVWTPGNDTRIYNGGAVTAVHMALLPGDGQYQSRFSGGRMTMRHMGSSEVCGAGTPPAAIAAPGRVRASRSCRYRLRR